MMGSTCEGGDQMNNRRFRLLPTLALVALATLMAVTVVSARPPAQEEVSEDLEQLAGIMPASWRVDDVIGDDPDEPGYRGPQPSTIDGDMAASEDAVGDAPDWEALMAGPQPDKPGYGEAKGPEWTDFYYAFVAGSSLRPRDSSSGWRYQGVGCVYINNGNQLMTVDLNIPAGARIDYLRLYYRDTSASNSTAWITTYDGAGAFTDLTNVSSAGNSGYGTTLSPLVSHVVNNASRSYSLNWQANQTGTSMQLCGLRVAYRLPT
jgi:hypothetical protein